MTVKVKVWGDYALFTRPEAKVERVSYPIITPSAARGLLESIFWKPEFYWRIKRIHVLKPIQYYSLLRNEVSSVIQPKATKTKKAFLADEDRQQRHSVMLKNVAYLIEADIVCKEYVTDDVAKYRDMFRRRVAKGQCFHRPFFGAKECTAHFAEPATNDKAIDITDELGLMLFDIRFPKDSKSAIPYFFEAKLERGILNVPTTLYEEVQR